MNRDQDFTLAGLTIYPPAANFRQYINVCAKNYVIGIGGRKSSSNNRPNIAYFFRAILHKHTGASRPIDRGNLLPANFL